MKCKHCKHKTECADDAFINGAEFVLDVEHECAGYEPFTNADRIRAMRDEELSEWLGEHLDCINCPSGVTCVHGNGCPGSLVEWLKQPAEE